VARTPAHSASSATSNEVLKPLVQATRPASTSLKIPVGLMHRHTIKVMVKINLAITLLRANASELCNYRLMRVANNPCDSTEMLNIDEGIALIDNRSKTLQT